MIKEKKGQILNSVIQVCTHHGKSPITIHSQANGNNVELVKIKSTQQMTWIIHVVFTVNDMSRSKWHKIHSENEALIFQLLSNLAYNQGRVLNEFCSKKAKIFQEWQMYQLTSSYTSLANKNKLRAR